MMLHGTAHPPPVSSIDVKYITTTEIIIVEEMIKTTTIIRRIVFLVLSFSRIFKGIS